MPKDLNSADDFKAVQDLAGQIKAAVDSLNAMIKRAKEDGLTVDVQFNGTRDILFVKVKKEINF